MEKILYDLGLSPNEAVVYMACLRLGKSTTTTLAREVSLHRGYLYDVLDSLKEKGLVSGIKQGRTTVFCASSPEHLLSFADEQIEELDVIKNKLASNMTKFKQLFASHAPHEAMLFTGAAGVRSVFMEMLKEKEILTYGANGYCTLRYPLFYRSWDKSRATKKIKLKILFDTPTTPNVAEPSKHVTIHYLDLEENNITNTTIYGNKVAIIIWDHNPIVFKIESDHVAKAYRTYFSLLWKKAKPYKK